jgi:hypothetical protein
LQPRRHRVASRNAGGFLLATSFLVDRSIRAVLAAARPWPGDRRCRAAPALPAQNPKRPASVLTMTQLHPMVVRPPTSSTKSLDAVVARSRRETIRPASHVS